MFRKAHSPLRVLVSALALSLACASTPKRAETPTRMKDSAPEKIASQRASGTPHSVQLEPEDQRWGIDAARERKRQQDEAKARKQPKPGEKAVDVTTPAPAR